MGLVELFSRKKKRHAKAVLTFEQLRDIQNGKNISINVPPNVSVLWISCILDKKVEFDFREIDSFFDQTGKHLDGFRKEMDKIWKKVPRL